MILIRRFHRLCFDFCVILFSILICLSSLYFIHYIWCKTKHICTKRFLCPSRQLVLYKNLTKIFNNPYSLCSLRSARRGPHQYVIGVSAYLSKRENEKLLPKLKTFLIEYTKEAKEKYPNWIVRVYYYSLNLSKEEIFHLEKIYQNVDFCDSTNIPIFGNISKWIPGKIQRFLPLADPLVDIYMSRDIDSPILEREITAVQTWLNSKQTIHIMRDHPQHTTPILGGLWGIKLNKERLWMKNLSYYLLSPDVLQCYKDTHDQTFLEDYIWPHANMFKQTTLEYDSFLCEKFQNSLPFPTKKHSPIHFVGCRRPNCTGDEHPPCPKQCRPINHSDWIWC